MSMNITHRKIDAIKDKDYILNCHCKINYECDTPWKRKMPYETYRDEWFSMKNQIKCFYDYLIESAADKRTIAEIIEDSKGERIAYLWVPFCDDEESGFAFADIQDIYIEEDYRHKGLATELLLYAENKARENGAKVIRSGTGIDNVLSIKLHSKLGYNTYRYEFEKVLGDN